MDILSSMTPAGRFAVVLSIAGVVGVAIGGVVSLPRESTGSQLLAQVNQGCDMFDTCENWAGAPPSGCNYTNGIANNCNWQQQCQLSCGGGNDGAGGGQNAGGGGGATGSTGDAQSCDMFDTCVSWAGQPPSGCSYTNSTANNCNWQQRCQLFCGGGIDGAGGGGGQNAGGGGIIQGDGIRNFPCAAPPTQPGCITMGNDSASGCPLYACPNDPIVRSSMGGSVDLTNPDGTDTDVPPGCPRLQCGRSSGPNCAWSKTLLSNGCYGCGQEVCQPPPVFSGCNPPPTSCPGGAPMGVDENNCVVCGGRAPGDNGPENDGPTGGDGNDGTSGGNGTQCGPPPSCPAGSYSEMLSNGCPGGCVRSTPSCPALTVGDGCRALMGTNRCRYQQCGGIPVTGPPPPGCRWENQDRLNLICGEGQNGCSVMNCPQDPAHRQNATCNWFPQTGFNPNGGHCDTCPNVSCNQEGQTYPATGGASGGSPGGTNPGGTNPGGSPTGGTSPGENQGGGAGGAANGGASSLAFVRCDAFAAVASNQLTFLYMGPSATAVTILLPNGALQVYEFDNSEYGRVDTGTEPMFPGQQLLIVDGQRPNAQAAALSAFSPDTLYFLKSSVPLLINCQQGMMSSS